MEIPLALPRGDSIEGVGPVVIIGPNGSGKTRYAADLANTNKAEIVSALRNIQLQREISAYQPLQARNQLQSEISKRISRYWELSNEIDILFANLLADDAASAIRFSDAVMADPSTRPEDTVLQRARRLWSQVYPGRQISFETYSPVVRSEYSGDGASYTADRMSDGERVALYLVARVLNAKAGILIIDEPELYFHSRLAVRFWDELEQERSDVRFVYITHDLPFALSRQEAHFLLVKPNTEPLSLPVDQNLPESLAVAILGAASFSIYAKRIVFWEGTEGEKGDYALYRAWFTERTTAVIPVGSCQDVLRCVESFGSSKFVIGVSAIGIIDRDHWPDHFFSSLAPEVHVLRVHEVESLYCIRGVFMAVAKQLSISEADASAKYEEFRHRVVKESPDSLITKEIAERCKVRLEPLVLGRIANLKGADDLAIFEEQASSHLDPTSWILNGLSILTEEKQRILGALRRSEQELLAILPGKFTLPIVARILGLNLTAYKKMVEGGLASNREDGATFRSALEISLRPYLPSREYIDPAAY